MRFCRKRIVRRYLSIQLDAEPAAYIVAAAWARSRFNVGNLSSSYLATLGTSGAGCRGRNVIGSRETEPMGAKQRLMCLNHANHWRTAMLIDWHVHINDP